jgi:ubiquitin-like 1-activating enzyme E1 B
MQKLSTLKLIYGEELAEKVTAARLLVVGAGGIGCEVMKTLSVTGFTQVTIVRKKDSSIFYRLTWTPSM